MTNDDKNIIIDEVCESLRDVYYKDLLENPKLGATREELSEFLYGMADILEKHAVTL